MKKLFVCFFLVMSSMVLFPAFGSCQEFNPKNAGIEVLSNGKFIRFSNSDIIKDEGAEEILLPIDYIAISRERNARVKITTILGGDIVTLKFQDDEMAQKAFEKLVSMIEDVD